MTRRAVLCVCALLLLPVLSAAQAPAPAKTDSLTGKWEGAFVISMNGESRDEGAVMNLTVKDKVLTGTVGPNADRQWTIQDGKVDGNKLTFGVQADGPFLKFTLTLADGRLKGDAAGEMNGQTFAAKVDVGRAK
jgi:hypothetical protein